MKEKLNWYDSWYCIWWDTIMHSVLFADVVPKSHNEASRKAAFMLAMLLFKLEVMPHEPL